MSQAKILLLKLNPNLFVFSPFGLSMVCAHGLFEENCPHCMNAARVKPAIRLVEPKPTELPIDLDAKLELDSDKKLHSPGLYSPKNSTDPLAMRLERNFNPMTAHFNQAPNMLQQRLNKIQSRWGQPGDISAVMPLNKIEDGKKKYLK
jgi:hypothetical protein